MLVPGSARREPVYCPRGIRHKGGMTLVQAFAWNVGCAGKAYVILRVKVPSGQSLASGPGASLASVMVTRRSKRRQQSCGV